MLNKVIILGRLTKDPQGGTTNAGKDWARFTVAVNRVGDGVDFLNVVAWEKLAVNCCKYLAKGKQVAVVGRIQTGTSERNGIKQSTFDIIAETVEFIGGGDNGGQKSNSDASIDTLREVDEDDDIPF